jgi:hypothetical protein
MLRRACLFLLLGVATAHAGIAQYTDRGKTDFDTAIQLLNPYGTWSQIDGLWAYTPANHEAPYTNGRWLYTDYGWYWKGSVPTSWATEHYGYWKRGTDHVWSWYPTAYWISQIVEIRATSDYIGWRSAPVDSDGNFVEPAADRYAKVDEWSFVSNAQFTRPITPDLIVKPEFISKLLDESAESMHTYVTYRPIDRPGPHPADFFALNPDGGMFPPKVEEGGAPPPVQVAVAPAKPAAPSTNAARSSAPANLLPSGLASAAPAPASTNAAPDPGSNDDAAIDQRQVRYWTTMSLPSYWTPPPADAKPSELYVYRPEFYQDQDGIERRIRLWLNPNSRLATGEHLRDVLSGEATAKSPTPLPGAPNTPGVPAEPASPAAEPFHSPLDDSFHGDTKGHTPNPSSKAAPSGAVTNGATD